jgi:hypothetical protein
MSNQWYQPAEFDDDDNDEGQGQPNTGQQLPKGLRTRMKQLETENKTLRETNEKLATEARKSAISQVLKTKNIDPKVANLVPKDVEPTAEAVEKWLADYADVFPVKAAEGESGNPDGGQDGDGDTGADSDEAAQMALIAQAANGGQPPGKQADLLKQLTAKDLKREDLLALIEAHGGGLGAG